MALRSKTFTTDAAPGHEPITAMGNCKRIRIREKPPAGTIPYVGGTSGFQLFGVKPDGTTDTVPITIFAGEETVLQSPELAPSGQSKYFGYYTAGETVAFISALAGTITIEQTEEG